MVYCVCGLDALEDEMGLGPWTLQRILVWPISTSDDPVEFARMWRWMVRCRIDFALRVLFLFLSLFTPDGREDGWMARRFMDSFDLEEDGMGA